MKTEAVMCIAFTRQSPSRTRLSATAFSTSEVMFTKSIRAGTFKVKYCVWAFMARSLSVLSVSPWPVSVGSGLRLYSTLHCLEHLRRRLAAHALAEAPAGHAADRSRYEQLHLPALAAVELRGRRGRRKRLAGARRLGHGTAVQQQASAADLGAVHAASAPGEAKGVLEEQHDPVLEGQLGNHPPALALLLRALPLALELGEAH